MRVQKITGISNNQFNARKTNTLGIKNQNAVIDSLPNYYVTPLINFKGSIEKSDTSFENTHAKFTLDKYQKEAIEQYRAGHTTIVSAPTGTGKTLIAEYIIKDAIENDKKMIYLAPTKALSNDKFTELTKLFGSSNVGLLTGDNSGKAAINRNAPVVVMTTEIYRNSLLNGDTDYSEYDGVIYDEFHYLNENERGTVWEESVILTPPNMKQLMLSATASNAEKIQEWVEGTNPDIKTALITVPEGERHVPLREYVLVRGKKGLELRESKYDFIDTYKITNKLNLTQRQQQAIEEAKGILKLESDSQFEGYLSHLATKKQISASKFSFELQKNGMDKERADAISLILSNKSSAKYDQIESDEFIKELKYNKLSELLSKNNMTPALVYIFSKSGCDNAMLNAALNTKSLLNEQETRAVEQKIEEAQNKGIYLGANFEREDVFALLKGFASHHAGKMPAYKSLVENLARQGLVKVCFSTDTMLTGINMPFRTTVFPSLVKYDGEDFTDILPATFKQGAGRAGRRGKDNIGNVVIVPFENQEYQSYVSLSKSKDTSIESHYNPSYASILSESFLNKKDDVLLKTLSAYESDEKFGDKVDKVEEKIKVLEKTGLIETDENGQYKRTYRGDIAKNIFGTNEIIFANIIDSDLLYGLNPLELTAFCTMFADNEGVDEPKRELPVTLSYLDERQKQILGIIDEVNEIEKQTALENRKEGEEYDFIKPNEINTTMIPYVLQFAKGEQARKSSLKAWQDAVLSMEANENKIPEGAFLRLINKTRGLLNTISNLSPEPSVRLNAEIAASALQKPPVTDIVDYEL